MFTLFPADKAVYIVGEKHKKAGNHRQVGDVIEGSEHPQDNEYDVICGVGNGVIGISAHHEI